MLDRKPPLKRSDKPMKRTQLAKVSKKFTTVVAPRRRQFRAAVLKRDGYRCQFNLRLYRLDAATRWKVEAVINDDALRCAGSIDAHHIRPKRSEQDDDPANGKTLCRAHHAWVHNHPEEAKLLGLLESALPLSDPIGWHRKAI